MPNFVKKMVYKDQQWLRAFQLIRYVGGALLWAYVTKIFVWGLYYGSVGYGVIHQKEMDSNISELQTLVAKSGDYYTMVNSGVVLLVVVALLGIWFVSLWVSWLKSGDLAIRILLYGLFSVLMMSHFAWFNSTILVGLGVFAVSCNVAGLGHDMTKLWMQLYDEGDYKALHRWDHKSVGMGDFIIDIFYDNKNNQHAYRTRFRESEDIGVLDTNSTENENDDLGENPYEEIVVEGLGSDIGFTVSESEVPKSEVIDTSSISESMTPIDVGSSTESMVFDDDTVSHIQSVLSAKFGDAELVTLNAETIDDLESMTDLVEDSHPESDNIVDLDAVDLGVENVVDKLQSQRKFRRKV